MLKTIPLSPVLLANPQTCLRKAVPSTMLPSKMSVICAICQKPPLLPSQGARLLSKKRWYKGTLPRWVLVGGSVSRPTPPDALCSEYKCSGELRKEEPAKLRVIHPTRRGLLLICSEGLGPKMTGQRLSWSLVCFLDPEPPGHSLTCISCNLLQL